MVTRYSERNDRRYCGVFLAIVGFKVVEYRAEQAVLVETPEVEETEDTPLVLEFYEALKDYKVLPRG